MAHYNSRYKLAKWTQAIKQSAMQLLLSRTNQDTLTFGLGLPATELFPLKQFEQATARLMTKRKEIFQYAPPSEELKQQIVKLMSVRGVKCSYEQIFLTAGAQQGISLLCRLLADRGDYVVCESLAYPGFLQAILPLHPKLITVPTGLDGLDLIALEAQLKKVSSIAFMYIVTDGHNPLGISLSQEKRLALIKLARDYQVPIIEDDPYGLLCYGSPLPPLKAYDAESVFYVGSFSKILAPSLRMGWIVMPEILMEPLSILKESSDINTATFSQHLIETLLEEFSIEYHINTLQAAYTERRDCMISAIKKYLPQTCRYSIPNNGLFIWLELSRDIDTQVLLELALETENLAFIPGSAFNVANNEFGSNCLRLNFSALSCSTIQDGIKRLGRCVELYKNNISME